MKTKKKEKNRKFIKIMKQNREKKSVSKFQVIVKRLTNSISKLVKITAKTKKTFFHLPSGDL